MHDMRQIILIISDNYACFTCNIQWNTKEEMWYWHKDLANADGMLWHEWTIYTDADFQRVLALKAFW